MALYSISLPLCFLWQEQQYNNTIETTTVTVTITPPTAIRAALNAMLDSTDIMKQLYIHVYDLLFLSVTTATLQSLQAEILAILHW